ncbi:MAG: hypothetical protein GDA48_29190 [Hormoscilla sp. GM102CHS1]|nr:hypothetical protein [Hormoscilla sp. GM102CHS1]
MQAIIKSSCIIGLSLITSGLGMNYASAQDLSHDVSGTNIVNSPVPIIFTPPAAAPAAGTAGGPAEGTTGGTAEGNQISPEIVATVTQLSQDLQNAYDAYNASNDSVSDQQLSSAIESAEDFLNNLNESDLNEQIERAGRAGRTRIW